MAASVSTLTRYLTVPQAAQMMGCSARSVRRMIADRRLRAFRIGTAYRIAATDLVGATAT